MSPYHTNPQVRKVIDTALHQNAIIFQDPKLPKSDKVRMERDNLLSVRSYDEKFIDFLLTASDD